jgi:hypothetical protein
VPTPGDAIRRDNQRRQQPGTEISPTITEAQANANFLKSTFFHVRLTLAHAPKTQFWSIHKHGREFAISRRAKSYHRRYPN